MTPDVNVLIAAARNEHPHHTTAAGWLDRAAREATQRAPLVLLPPVLTGYVRLMQNRSAFPVPVSPTRSLRFVDALLREPNVVIGTLGPEWGRFANLYLRHTPVGGGVTDAWLAAAVLELKVHFVTFDRGFRKLLPPEQLTLLDPAAS